MVALVILDNYYALYISILSWWSQIEKDLLVLLIYCDLYWPLLCWRKHSSISNTPIQYQSDENPILPQPSNQHFDTSRNFNIQNKISDCIIAYWYHIQWIVIYMIYETYPNLIDIQGGNYRSFTWWYEHVGWVPTSNQY